MGDIPFNQSAPADGYDHQAINQMFPSVPGSNQAAFPLSDLDAPSDMMEDDEALLRNFCEGNGDYPPAAHYPTGPAVQEEGSLRQRYLEGSPSEHRNKQTSSAKRSTTGQKRQLSSDKEQGRSSTGGGRGNRPHPSFNRQADSMPATNPRAGSSRGRSRNYVKGDAPQPQVYHKLVDPSPALNRRVDTMSVTYPPVQSIRASTPLSGWMQNQFLQYGSMPTSVLQSSSMPTPVLQSSSMPAPGLHVDLTLAGDLQSSLMPASDPQSSSMPASDHQTSSTRAPVLQFGSIAAPSSPTKSSRSGRGKKKREKAKNDHEFYCHDHKRGFGSKHDLARHYQDTHDTKQDGTPIERFRCTHGGCQKNFRRQSNLLSHIRSQHEGKSTSNENLNNGSSSVQLAEAYARPVATQQASQTVTQPLPLQPLSPNQVVSNHPSTFSESKDSSEQSTEGTLLFLKEELHLPASFVEIYKLVDRCLALSKEALRWRKREQELEELFDQMSSNPRQPADPTQRAKTRQDLDDFIANRVRCEIKYEKSRSKLTRAVFQFQNGAAQAGGILPAGVMAAQPTGVSLI